MYEERKIMQTIYDGRKIELEDDLIKIDGFLPIKPREESIGILGKEVTLYEVIDEHIEYCQEKIEENQNAMKFLQFAKREHYKLFKPQLKQDR